MNKGDELFAWSEGGSFDLQVKLGNQDDIAHEVMYEDEVLKIKERPLYLGQALPRRRSDVALALSLLLVVGLAGRAFWMQVIAHKDYLLLAERNRLRSEVIQPTRGIIRDREGTVLADNMSTFDVAATPIDLPNTPEARTDLLGRIARVSGLPLADLENDIATAKSLDQKIILARDIPYDQAIALRISLADAPGVTVEAGRKRRYPLSTANPTFSHILGYTGKMTTQELADPDNADYQSTDTIGKTGVESSYEKLLRGIPGERVVEVDSFGHEQRVVHESQPVSGKDLILTVDAQLQKTVEDALKNGLQKAKVSKGSAIVMDPRDGSILAIASWPAYDDNIFSGRVSSTAYAAYLNNPDNPFLARAWAGLFPSGSTIKPVYAVALLAEHIITPYTTVLSTGGVKLGASFFPDWLCGGHDDFVGLGAVKMGEWLKRFGFGARLGLDIPGEQAGFVPTPDWKLQKKHEKWYVGDTYNFAIGQGDLLVTPLQIAVATSEVANGGKRLTPHVAFGQSDAPSTTDGPALAPSDAIEVVRLGMRDTVVSGSGRALSTLPFPVAGKTGTAQWRNDRPNHAWFTAFAPFDKPEVTITIMLEEGVEGSSTAVPVAKDILMAWYKAKDTLDKRPAN